MKLHYFKDHEGNFGDDLNPWLWGRLLPDFFDADDSELFVGIGTLLNHRLPADPLKHVFGSGLGYGDAPRVDASFEFHAVRGFDTARALGLSRQLVITDAAVLVRAVDRPPPTPGRHRVGFIPTGQSIRTYDWESMCRDLGYCYISCHWDVERVLGLMVQCDVLLCEAMHGAIVADALRLPWVPVCCNDDILAFKWKDWLSTLDLPYEPSRIATVQDFDRHGGRAGRVRNAVKRGLKGSGLWSAGWTEPPPPRSTHIERQRALEDLRAAAARPPYLSADRIVVEHTERYLDLLVRFRKSRGSRASA